MDNIYSKPNSELVSRYKKDFNFSNLGVWRKLYLIINWFFVGIIPILIVFSMFSSKHGDSLSGISIWQIIIILFFGVYTYWLHFAVSRRNTTQLLVLLIVQIIPFLNPISALILFLIRKTSQKELEEV